MNSPKILVVAIVLFLINSILGNDCELKCGRRPDSQQRIMGGDISDEAKWPWVFELKGWNSCGEQFCTAQLIDPHSSSHDHKLRAVPVHMAEAGIGALGARCRAEWKAKARLCAGSANSGGLKGDSGAGVNMDINHVNFFTHGVMSMYKDGNLNKVELAPLIDNEEEDVEEIDSDDE
uniref:C2H2-type domain-containing protein n=1 Tax=Meloidogyne javanica TaxID=6303 RepID=A0A915MZK7_MELJA